MFSTGRKKQGGGGNKAVVPRLRNADADSYTMPPEEYRHEGTWLQWPHNYGWDVHHVKRYETSWVQMARALHTGERVHIIVYDDTERDRVESLLRNVSLNMDQIDFYVWPTDDVWARDNGPIFVFDNHQKLCIVNFVFNGWGGKADYYYDNYIPLKVGHALNVPVIDIPMVHEGGSVEVDGRGTLLAKRSSILNVNRNAGWTQKDVERYFQQYLGVTNFIWLEGRKGGDDITDDHIDGTARFANGDTIVTYYERDFVNPGEYKILQKAVDVDGRPYRLVHLPVTTKNVPGVGDYGIYINFYVGNDVVLVPSYDDPNDPVAAEILQLLFPTRQVVSIPSTEVFRDGGMMHCVTQQQPVEKQERSSLQNSL
jgi:agmatine deiminase